MNIILYFVALRLPGCRVHPDECGASAVEYALLTALIAVVIVGVVTALGVNIGAVFGDPNLNNALSP